ncbi:MAG: hypothetical protein AAGJ08_25520 [Cyanobacteria bacterium P01_H01_bin.35]
MYKENVKALLIKNNLASVKHMKKLSKNNQEGIWKENIVKTKRKGYFRNIQEVKVVATVANIAQEPSASKSFTSKVWVAYTSI